MEGSLKEKPDWKKKKNVNTQTAGILARRDRLPRTGKSKTDAG